MNEQSLVTSAEAALRAEIHGDLGQVISGRSLHAFLQVETPYTIWFPRMCEYGFEDGKDFVTNLLESTGGRPSTDHYLKLDMAKELAMLARSPRGKMARLYFIELERKWNSPEMVMARALKMMEKRLTLADVTVQRLEKQIKHDAPKVLFAKAYESSSGLISMNAMAKHLHQRGVNMGQNRLFKWCRQSSLLMKRQNEYLPTQRAMELGIFELKTSVRVDPTGKIVPYRTVQVTGKGQVYFINRFLGETTLLLNWA